jgi:hypothetical protein
MKRDETDPERRPGDDGPTDPGPAPSARENDTAPDAPDADTLLENLGPRPAPVRGVKATRGHMAAAYASHAHAPPKRFPTAAPAPPVVVAQTDPPAEAPAVSSEERAARQAPTLPSTRLRAPEADLMITSVRAGSGVGARSLALALLGVLVLAASIVVAMTRGPAQPPQAAVTTTTTGAATAETTKAMAALTATVATVATVATATADTPAPVPDDMPTATIPRPTTTTEPHRGAARTAASGVTPATRPPPRPSPNIVEPERTF